MNKIKKTTLWDRLRNAARAFKGKPVSSISLGVEVKQCDKCDRGNCEGCVYKGEFERLMDLPGCHDCGLSTGNSCGHRPKLGEDIRINCPLWQPKKTHDGYRIDHVIYDVVEREDENDAT